MSPALVTPAPIARRRGACPSLDAPMQTGDGLLARLRIAGGRLTPEQMIAIAGLAGQYGNGLVEISARGNLQVRGLSAASSPQFASGVREVVSIETGLVVETPPLAGDDPQERADPRQLADTIRGLATPFADRLGPKVTVVVDGAGQITLDHLKADIRLVTTRSGHWQVSVGNGAAVVLPVDAARALAIATLQQIAALGIDARATDLPCAAVAAGVSVSSPIGRFTRRDGSATGIALPFGSVKAEQLMALARLAARHGVSAIRLAPDHCILAFDAPPTFAADAGALGFITDPNDPRIRISACIGSDGCASGHIPAREIADQLVAALPLGQTLHVSGCSKGCAHPRCADVTLVGRADGIGLVISGTAGDTPRAVLGEDALESALAGARG